MKKFKTAFSASTLAMIVMFTGAANAESANSVKLLTAQFEPRDVVKIEAGDFHFIPGQDAPVHTHAAPAIGYVFKGGIIYQIEGEKPQTLRQGDVFYEPVGPNIIQFNNASATEEAIFIDFNLQQDGEPFIIFPEPLTEDIDRRTLPTIELKTFTTDQANIHETELASGETMELINNAPTFGIVAQGVVEISFDGAAPQRVIAGASFSVPSNATVATLENASSEVSAMVITFALQPANVSNN